MMKYCFVTAIALWCLISQVFSPAFANGPQQSEEAHLDGIARGAILDVYDQISAGKVSGLILSYAAQFKPVIDQVVGDEENVDLTLKRIALAPLDSGDTGVNPAFLERIEQHLLHHVVRENSGEFIVVSRSDLRAVIAELDAFKRDGISETQAITELFQKAGGDYLLVPKLSSLNERELKLSIKAIEATTGHILSSSMSRPIPYAARKEAQQTTAITVDQAFQRAARNLLLQAKNLKALTISGVRYAESGVEGPFGQYARVGLADALANQFQRQNGRTITLKQSFPQENEGARGAGSFENKIAAMGKAGHYILDASYWPLGDVVEFRIQLRNGAERTASWRGRVKRDAISLPLAPQNVSMFHVRDGDHLGPFELRLSSDRGPDPIYRVGEFLFMDMMLGHDAFVSCFYQQADSALIRVFPNRLHSNGFLKGGDRIRLPEPHWGFLFPVKDPTGSELMKCFATDRNPLGDLPHGWGEVDFETLVGADMSSLVQAMRSIADIRISESSMAVTVTQ